MQSSTSPLNHSCHELGFSGYEIHCKSAGFSLQCQCLHVIIELALPPVLMSCPECDIWLEAMVSHRFAGWILNSER